MEYQILSGKYDIVSAKNKQEAITKFIQSGYSGIIEVCRLTKKTKELNSIYY